jgi:dihydrodipicolinate synthase/N-acetylneuraminate lyase
MSDFKLSGCVVPMITPLQGNSGNLEIDIPAVIRLLDMFIRTGVSAVFILGNAGAFQWLTLEQKLSLLEAVSANCKNLPVLVGVSDPDWSNSQSLITRCEELKVTGLVWVPYFRSVPIEKLMTATALPVILYNNPGICNNTNLTPEMVRNWLVLYPSRIIGVKESSGDFDLFNQYVRLQLDTGLPVMKGDAKSLVQAKGLENQMPGYHLSGGVPVHANVDPETYVGFIGDGQSGKDLVNKYAVQFPSIGDTIREMVNHRQVKPQTLTFWLAHQ